MELAAAESLRAEVRQREWVEGARRLLSSQSSKISLNILAEYVEEAAAMGAAGTDAYVELRAKVEAAQVCVGTGCMPACMRACMCARVAVCAGPGVGKGMVWVW